MNITIQVETEGRRHYVEVHSEGATRIPGIHKTLWYSPAWRKRGLVYYSLVHLETGRALNKVPLTDSEVERLLDALQECDIEWDRIASGESARVYYVERLTPEAAQLAGAAAQLAGAF